MKIITLLFDITTTLLRVLEVEGRVLKKGMMKLIWAFAFVGIAALLVSAAAVFFLAGIYQYLTTQTSPQGASLLVSLLALILALIFAGIAKLKTTDSK